MYVFGAQFSIYSLQAIQAVYARLCLSMPQSRKANEKHARCFTAKLTAIAMKSKAFKSCFYLHMPR